MAVERAHLMVAAVLAAAMKAVVGVKAEVSTAAAAEVEASRAVGTAEVEASRAVEMAREPEAREVAAAKMAAAESGEAILEASCMHAAKVWCRLRDRCQRTPL